MKYMIVADGMLHCVSNNYLLANFADNAYHRMINE